MAATDDTRLKGRTRWSMAARCPRQAAYGLLGADPEPPDEITELRWARGKMDETWFVEHVLEPRFGRRNIQREKAVPWPNGNGAMPVGELHQDVYVRSERTVFEIKSHLSGEPSDTDYVQLAGEVLYDPDVETKAGTLVVIDRDLKWEAIPVLAEHYREQIEETARQVIEAGKTGELPQRVCEKPADARSLMCPFADRCFADWEPPDPEHLDGDLAALAIDLKLAQDAERQARAVVDEAEKRRKEIAATLAEWELQPGVEYVATGVSLKRTKVEDSERLSLSTMRKAGAVTRELEQQLAPFITRSGGHDRWTVKRTLDVVPTNEDFGDVPF